MQLWIKEHRPLVVEQHGPDQRPAWSAAWSDNGLLFRVWCALDEQPGHAGPLSYVDLMTALEAADVLLHAHRPPVCLHGCSGWWEYHCTADPDSELGADYFPFAAERRALLTRLIAERSNE